MSAKEMFKKLGYEQNIYPYGNIIYKKDEEYNFKIIEFANKEIIINENDEYCPALLPGEIQSINQQCKELGWLE